MSSFKTSVVVLSLVLALMLGVMATGCAGDFKPQPLVLSGAMRLSPHAARGADASPFRFFSSRSFWNKRLPTRARVDRRSAAIMSVFVAEVASEEVTERGPSIDTARWSVPIYTVPAGQPMVKVALANPARAVALRSAWGSVPLPANAHPATGTDGHLVVWQPSTDRLWEFWRLSHATEGWQAVWGGAMRNVSSNPGVYGPEAWPGSVASWGGSASSLSLAGGIITFEDLERGVINHALVIAIPNVRAGVHSSPAQRDDGTSHNVLSLPEGAHLRLDPSLDLNALHLPRLTLMIARAAQRYGIFVRSRGAVVDFYGQDPVPTGVEPYAGPSGYFEGKRANQLMAAFPWTHLQLLKMHLHSDRRRPAVQPR